MPYGTGLHGNATTTAAVRRAKIVIHEAHGVTILLKLIRKYTNGDI